jgi:ATPase subunit of ABC transporter with duplicated ATPase domains
MIELDAISLHRGDKTLLENASLRIHPGEKTALVGANGAGKTSLFLLLQRQLAVDSGHLLIPEQWRVAHMAQEVGADDRSALEYVLDGDAELRRIQRELEIRATTTTSSNCTASSTISTATTPTAAPSNCCSGSASVPINCSNRSIASRAAGVFV